MKSLLDKIKEYILIYTKKIKKYFNFMANVYDNSFIDADILDGKLLFTRVNGSEYTINISQLQDSSTLKNVQLINNSLKFTKVSGDTTSIDLSSYNGFDGVSLDSGTKDLIFYNNNNEVTRVNFDTLINNSFISGNPFVSVDVIENNMVFTTVSGSSRSISIHNIQNQQVFTNVELISDNLKFTYLNGNIKQFSLSKYNNIDDVSYDEEMKFVFYKNGVLFKEFDIKASILNNIEEIITEPLSIETSQRISTDDILSTNLSIETTQRISSDVTLSTSLSIETTQRISSDVTLSISLSTSLSTETSQRVSTDAGLSTGLSQSISRDNSLSTSLSIEASQRISTDISLSSMVSSMVSTGTIVDISTETSQRISSDNILSISILNNLNKIDEINDILFTEEVLSGQTYITNNIEYLLESDLDKTTQINDLYENKADKTHVHPPTSNAEFKSTIKRLDVIWENEWIKITHPTTLNFNYGSKVINLKIFVNFGFGLIDLNPILNYGSTTSNSLSTIGNFFFVNDMDNVLNKNKDFDYIYIEYDVVVDYNYKYDSTKYILGENVVNDHYLSDANHSRTTGFSFNAAYMQIDNTTFSGDVIETVYDPLTLGSLNRGFTPTFCSIRDANMVFHPYVNGALNENYGSNPNILSVASHYGNTFIRYDVTNSASVFLDNSIAVVARPNNITQIDRSNPKHVNFTSFGYGAEFLEEASAHKMIENYTHWTSPNAYGWGYIDATGLIVTNLNNSSITRSHFNILELEVGTKLGIGLSYPHSSYQVRTVVEILSDFTLLVDTPFNPLETGTNYLFIHEAHIGSHWGVYKYLDYPTNEDSRSRIFWQSPTTGLVAGKLKKIKMETGVSWNIVREAARNTAYLYDNVTTITNSLTINSNIDKIYVSNTNVFPDADSGYPNRVIGTVKVNGNVFYFKGKNVSESYIYGDSQKINYAVNSGTEIKLIWDVYRGFGEIQVDDAITYINGNYKSEVYKNILADKLENDQGINNLLDYNSIYPNSPISKKMISDIAQDIKFTNIDEIASISNLGKIRYTRDGNSSVAQMCMQIGENVYDWVNITSVNTW